MKKALTIVLALVMALSMSAMAFAADATADAEAILSEIADVAKDNSAWDAVEGALTDVVAALEDKTAELADVEGEVINLNTVLEGIGLPSVDGLVDSLKETIKGMYAGETATVPETTVAEPIEDTGSASVGIAAFAAISVAAAAAYVCTKKN
ncbi:MAG: hypothetical protein E7547_08145 [Ruminococcaceae bacterium]|nr:hypothetical protein [Oscillospiraceae bacterium]